MISFMEYYIYFNILGNNHLCWKIISAVCCTMFYFIIHGCIHHVGRVGYDVCVCVCV